METRVIRLTKYAQEILKKFYDMGIPEKPSRIIDAALTLYYIVTVGKRKNDDEKQ